jgi:hypothetical protein
MWNWASHDDAGKGRLWLTARLWDDPRLRATMFEPRTSEDAPFRLRPAEYAAYTGRVRSMVLSLIALMHVTGGLPVRVSELFTLRYANSQVGGLRDILRAGAGWYFSPRLTKAFLRRGDTGTSFHLLPPEVGDVLNRYIWHVLPFLHEQAELLYGDRHIWSPFLVGGEPVLRQQGRSFTTDDALEAAGLDHDGNDVPDLDGDDDDSSDDNDNDDDDDTDSERGEGNDENGSKPQLCDDVGYGKSPEEQPSARGGFKTDTLGLHIVQDDLYKAIKAFFRRYLGQSLNSREWRHLSTALMRRLVPEERSGLRSTPWSLEVMHMQANHSAKTADVHYAPSRQGPFTYSLLREQHFRFSKVFWLGLGIPSAVKDTAAVR